VAASAAALRRDRLCQQGGASALAPPVPLELVRFGAQRTLLSLEPARLRDVAPSPDGGLIADYLGPIGTRASSRAG
jgi:hypothetical protein